VGSLGDVGGTELPLLVRVVETCEEAPDGCLNETTWTPWGFTPGITCSIALSLPAASMAWKTTRTA
jgi:hypothetical protein